MNSIRRTSRRLACLSGFLLMIISLTFLPASLQAQNQTDIEALKQQAGELIRQQKFTDALPLLEKIVAAEPDDAQSQLYLGFALLGQANNTQDKTARKRLRVRAREAFVKAKKLGKDEPLVDGLIQSIPPDGRGEGEFSQNDGANDAMREAEAAFAQGDLDKALANYQKALKLDPQIYEAALFSGDVYTQKGDFTQAEVWYQKAITINPYRETAYRYSATPLMKQSKLDQARDRYIEAYIVEPYSNFAIAGISQWAEAAGVSLGHPRIEIPASVGKAENGNTTITLGAGPDDDGSFAWFGYGGTRALWQNGKDGALSEKFRRAYPEEKQYRHSLAEEAEALQSTVTILKERMKDKNSPVKNLSPSLARLVKLADAGLLEPYVLLARADRGIAYDHAVYLRANRDKLRRYVLEFVIGVSEK